MDFKKNIDLVFFGVFVLLSTIGIALVDLNAFSAIIWGWILMGFAGFLCWRKGWIKFNFPKNKNKG